jgi:hypothetical protein
MSDDKVNKILKRADNLFSSEERVNVEHVWTELSEFMLNHQSGIFTTTATALTDFSNTMATSPGSKKTKRVYDSTALQAVQDLASAFQGTLTNPATVWSTLRFQDETLNNNAEATSWLEEANKILHNKFNESNFNTEIAKGYQSFVSLANMVLFVERGDDTQTFRFTSLHLARIAWAEDKNSIVDTIYRKFDLSARQAFEKWGTRVHDNILRDVERDPDKQYSFMHCVLPRDPKDIKLNEVGLAPGEDRPIASIYIDTTHSKIVEETGYYEMPILAARWSLMPSETYGRGPGHYALPDTRSLNKLMEEYLTAVAKDNNPPILANQRDIFGSVDMRPKTISLVKDINGIREMTSTARMDRVFDLFTRLTTSIRSIFFLDKLLLPDRRETGEMTAFEVSQRIEQMQRVLGPTLSRLNNELLSPLIVRSFKILLREGLLPEMPAILRERGLDVDIVFVNQLARAQQIQDVNTINQWVQGLLVVAQANPAVIDNINVDGIAKHTGKILGVPEVVIQNDEAMAALRQQRAQQAQQAQALESATKVADISSKTDQT